VELPAPASLQFEAALLTYSELPAASVIGKEAVAASSIATAMRIEAATRATNG